MKLCRCGCGREVVQGAYKGREKLFFSQKCCVAYYNKRRDFSKYKPRVIMRERVGEKSHTRERMKHGAKEYPCKCSACPEGRARGKDHDRNIHFMKFNTPPRFLPWPRYCGAHKYLSGVSIYNQGAIV